MVYSLQLLGFDRANTESKAQLNGDHGDRLSSFIHPMFDRQISQSRTGHTRFSLSLAAHQWHTTHARGGSGMIPL